jgi:hypothetical protein
MLRQKALNTSFLVRLIIKTNSFRNLLVAESIYRLNPLLYRQGGLGSMGNEYTYEKRFR